MEHYILECWLLRCFIILDLFLNKLIKHVVMTIMLT